MEQNFNGESAESFFQRLNQRLADNILDKEYFVEPNRFNSLEKIRKVIGEKVDKDSGDDAVISSGGINITSMLHLKEQNPKFNRYL